jgi:hypothetical protein
MLGPEVFKKHAPPPPVRSGDDPAVDPLMALLPEPVIDMWIPSPAE